MTGAEAKTLRERLGLSQLDIASRLPRKKKGGFGIEKKTYNHWESSSLPVNDDVQALLVHYRDSLEAQAKHSCDIAKGMRAEGKPIEAVHLFRYKNDHALQAAHPEMQGLPTSFHAAILMRTQALLRENGFEAMIIWADE